MPPTETSGRLRIRIVTRFVTGWFAGVHVLRARNSYSRSQVNVPGTEEKAYEPLAGLSAPVTLGSSSGCPVGAGISTISAAFAFRTDQLSVRAAPGAICAAGAPFAEKNSMNGKPP